jgi:hypothetical protein
MRTSTKILIVTFVIFAASLMIYDFGLRAEYLKGEYTRPFNDYVPLNYRDFNEIELNASTAVNIMVVQGPFKVLANPAAMDFLKVTQQNKRLIVNAKFNEQYHSVNTDYILYISCPSLSVFSADAHYTKAGIVVTDTAANDFAWKATLISGFTATNLDIKENHAANVILENNKINSLGATVGLNEKSRSNLTIGENNRFNKTDLNILNKSHLWIKGTNTNNINYHLADSATLVVNGAAAKHFLKLY